MLEGLTLERGPGLFLPGRVLDYKKIMALSDQDFARFYLELMEEYREKDGWWGEGGIPRCSECNRKISGPGELRRYCGASLHPRCFQAWYQRHGGDEKGIMKRFWERVFKLDLSEA